jgi:flagellar basal-body rod modification protein FlgD
MDAIGNGLWTDRTQPKKPASSEPAARSPGTQEMDKEAFLRLLLTQLKYQDPLSPTQDKEFIAQMAQFSALEQMRNMSSTLERSASYALIGKMVKASARDEATGENIEVEGLVDAVVVKNGAAYFKVGGKEAPVGSAIEVAYGL